MQTFEEWKAHDIDGNFGVARRAWNAGQAALRGRMEALAKKLIANVGQCCPDVLTPGPKPSSTYGDVHQSCIAEKRCANAILAALDAPIETGKPAGKAEPR